MTTKFLYSNTKEIVVPFGRYLRTIISDAVNEKQECEKQPEYVEIIKTIERECDKKPVHQGYVTIKALRNLTVTYPIYGVGDENMFEALFLAEQNRTGFATKVIELNNVITTATNILNGFHHALQRWPRKNQIYSVICKSLPFMENILPGKTKWEALSEEAQLTLALPTKEQSDILLGYITSKILLGSPIPFPTYTYKNGDAI